ncbi:MAG: hypothetical protein OWT28_06450 [Firmicutes bacterium]|nr:hypothetical protein [Bacillota bacterium]
MAFAYKKPKMGFMNIDNMVKGFPTSNGVPTPIGAQHARLAYAAHENAGAKGTTIYKGHRMPLIAATVGISIQKGALVSQQLKDERRNMRLQATSQEIAALQAKGFGQYLSVSSRMPLNNGENINNATAMQQPMGQLNRRQYDNYRGGSLDYY